MLSGSSGAGGGLCWALGREADGVLSGSSGIDGDPGCALGREFDGVVDEVELPPISSEALSLLSLCASWSGSMDEDVSNAKW